jgi:hypothetical protein
MVARSRSQGGRDRGTQGCVRLNDGCERSIVAVKHKHFLRDRVNNRGVRDDMDRRTADVGRPEAWR